MAAQFTVVSLAYANQRMIPRLQIVSDL